MKNVPDIPREILDASSRGKLVVFIGAGVSRIIGCPSWKEFALKHLDHLFEIKAINFYEFSKLKKMESRKLLSICQKIYKEKKHPPKQISDLLQANEESIKKYPIYDDLYAFNAIYLTTNYDVYLDKAAAAQKSNRGPMRMTDDTSGTEVPMEGNATDQIINAPEDLLVTCLKNGNVIHLHGSTQNEHQLIVTIVDYISNYNKGSKLAVMLEEVFKTYTVLFVGYGLEEYEILEFMINKSLIVQGTIQHYMLYPCFESESNLLRLEQKYYSDLGVHLIPYPVDENGYGQLATVIRDWATQIAAVARTQSYYNKVKLIDEVI